MLKSRGGSYFQLQSTGCPSPIHPYFSADRQMAGLDFAAYSPLQGNNAQTAGARVMRHGLGTFWQAKRCRCLGFLPGCYQGCVQCNSSDHHICSPEKPCQISAASPQTSALDKSAIIKSMSRIEARLTWSWPGATAPSGNPNSSQFGVWAPGAAAPATPPCCIVGC